MTQPSAHQQVDSAPASTDVTELNRAYKKHWHVWRSSDGLLYATRREDLTPVELSDRLPDSSRPHRTVFAETKTDLIELIEAQYELVARVTDGHKNPLNRD